MPPVTTFCGRAGCPGAVLQCRAGCSGTPHCSEGCHMNDRYRGHAVCAFESLRDSASRGPLTTQEYRQACYLVGLNRDNPLIQCATLHILQSNFTAFPSPDPTGVPQPVIDSSLLLTLTALLSNLAPSPRNQQHTIFHITHEVLLADSIGALISAILAPGLAASHIRLLRVDFPHTVEDVDPPHQMYLLHGKSTSASPSLAQLLLAYGLPLLPPACVAIYHRISAEARALCRALPLPRQQTPGAKALLASGRLALVQDGLNWSGVPNPFGLVPNASTVCNKIIAVLEQDGPHLQLPHAGLVGLLGPTLEYSNGALLGPLLQCQAGMAALVKPLQALAQEATVWSTGYYHEHLHLLQALCEASDTHGVVDSLAKSLAKPAVEAMGALLELDPGNHVGPPILLQNVLFRLGRILHLVAPSSYGGRAIAQACDWPRWLARGVKWLDTHKEVTALLMHLLHIVAVYAARIEADQPQLSTDMCKGAQRDIIGVLVWLAKEHLPAMEPVMCALQKAASAKAWAAAVSVGARSMTLVQQRGSPNLDPGYLECAFRMVAEFYLQAKKRNVAVDVKPAITLALEWLDACATGATSGTFQATAETHIDLLESLLQLARVQPLNRQLTISSRIHERIVALMPCFTVPEEWHSAVHVIFDTFGSGMEGLTRNQVCLEETGEPGSMAYFLGHALGNSKALEPLLQCITHDWHSICSSAGVPQRRYGSTSSKAQFLEATVYMLTQAAKTEVWARLQTPWLKLLQTKAVCEVVEHSGDAHLTAAFSGVLMGLLMGHPGTQAAALAEARLQGMDPQVVQDLILELPIQMQAFARQWMPGRSASLQQPAGNTAQPPAASVSSAAAASSSSSSSSSSSRTDTTTAMNDNSSSQGGRFAGGASSTGRSRKSKSSGEASSSSSSGTSNAGREVERAAAAMSDAFASACAVAAPASADFSSAASGTAAPSKECSMCHARPEQTFLCSRCLGVRYCSVECQRADWKGHKKVCKQQQAGQGASAAGK